MMNPTTLHTLLEKPDGTVREVVFPVVGEQTLRDLVKEAKATGPSYKTTLRTVIRSSYKDYKSKRQCASIFSLIGFALKILKSVSPSPTRAIEQFQDDRNKALRLFSG